MADATVVAVDPPTEPPPEAGDFESGQHVPPLDGTFVSQHLFNGDGAAMGNQNDDMVFLDGFDFDLSFDDLGLPPSDSLDHLLNQTQLQQSNCQDRSGSDFDQFAPDFCQLDGAFKSAAAELCHLAGDDEFSGDQSWCGSGLLNSGSPETESHQISNYLNMQSPESNGSNRESADNCGGDGKGLSCNSPESEGSGNFESNVSEDSNNCAARSVSSSPNSINISVKTGVVDQKIKLEGSANNNNNNSNVSFLKRKKEGDDILNTSVESRINKSRKSNCISESTDCRDSDVVMDEEEEKKKARLLRNRESAQLSRQRKKHYVEELEDKVRNMHSTIQDLNAKITYFMAENATLKHQMGGGGGGGGGGGAAAVPPPPMAPPPPGMYTHPAMMYPWMPYAPPYMMKSQGSQVPLVPIPRLKPQQQAQAPKQSKKVESKKSEAPKTKKVAGVSFLGMLFFVMLFGGLLPMVNVRYGGTREVFTGGESYIRGGFNERHHGRVLMVNGTEYDEKRIGQGGKGSGGDPPSVDEFDRSSNGSEPLAASLYVPRNDKLVKIDGNLIIHSVLASEKAMASKGKGYGETGLVVPGNLAHGISSPVVGRNGARHTLLRALGSADNDGTKSTASDGKLQQWFREGLAGPMLSAGMCTEVFQFDVSAAIVPATSRNITEEQNKNSTHPSKARNRRILHPIPFPESSHNISEKNAGRRSEKEEFSINNKTSSMVVSVLFDPREAGDADVDGVMGTKSLSRIFVVVLIDSVKYVTYSCMLPFKGSAPHLVTT